MFLTIAKISKWNANDFHAQEILCFYTRNVLMGEKWEINSERKNNASSPRDIGIIQSAAGTRISILDILTF